MKNRYALEGMTSKSSLFFAATAKGNLPFVLDKKLVEKFIDLNLYKHLYYPVIIEGILDKAITKYNNKIFIINVTKITFTD